MLTRRRFVFPFLAGVIALSGALKSPAWYVPDAKRASYEVPEILELPDRIALDMKFRFDMTRRGLHKLPAWKYGIGRTRFTYKDKAGDTLATDCRGGGPQGHPSRRVVLWTMARPRPRAPPHRSRGEKSGNERLTRDVSLLDGSNGGILMFNRRYVAFALFAFVLGFLTALQGYALYMPDPKRASYEVPHILELPDRMAVDMKFRALDADSEWEVYPLMVPDFRTRTTTNAAEAVADPPDAFTRSLGLESGNALYWQSSLPGAERWCAVEYTRKRAIALYIDLNRDGKLGDHEKITPTDTTTRFAVPKFQRKRKGWTDHALSFFLDAKRTWAGDENPALSWSYLLSLGNEYDRRMPMWFPRDETIPDAPDDAFVQSVKTDGKIALHSQVRVKDQTQWTVVTVAEGVADTLFFDIDADGEVSERETIAPEYHEARFVVPTFTADFPDGKRRPYRAFLYARGRDAPAWCPGGVWEGPIALGKKAYRLILFDRNLNGSFSDFGEDGYAFFSEEGPIRILDEVMGFGSTRFVPTSTLQKLAQIEGVNLFGMGALEADDKDAAAGRMVLTRDTEKWGSLRISLGGPETVVATSGELLVWKSDRSDIKFRFDMTRRGPHKLPAWTYGIGRTRFSYKNEAGDTLESDCRGGEFEVSSNAAFHVKLGQLALHVRSKDLPEDERTPRIKRGDEVALTREITGAFGEVYTRFRNGTKKKWICSTLRILNETGKEVAVKTLGYG